MKYDDERFYFAHALDGFTVGGYAGGARSLVRKLRELGTAFPRWTLVTLRSEGEPVNDDPLRGQAFFPAAVNPDSQRDQDWMKQRARKAS